MTEFSFLSKISNVICRIYLLNYCILNSNRFLLAGQQSKIHITMLTHLKTPALTSLDQHGNLSSSQLTFSVRSWSILGHFSSISSLWLFDKGSISFLKLAPRPAYLICTHIPKRQSLPPLLIFHLSLRTDSIAGTNFTLASPSSLGLSLSQSLLVLLPPCRNKRWPSPFRCGQSRIDGR